MENGNVPSDQVSDEHAFHGLDSGQALLDLHPQAVNDVINLFRNETGEVYAEASVRHLPIPVWDANLVLVDLDQDQPFTIQGVMGDPFKDDIVRVAAFVIASKHQGKGVGNRSMAAFLKGSMAQRIQAGSTRGESRQYGRPTILHPTWHDGTAGTPWLLSVRVGVHDARPAQTSDQLKTYSPW